MSKELKKLVLDLQGNMDIIGDFMDNPEGVMDRYNIQGEERKIMLSRDSAALNQLGFSNQAIEGALSGAHSQRCHMPA